MNRQDLEDEDDQQQRLITERLIIRTPTGEDREAARRLAADPLLAATPPSGRTGKDGGVDDFALVASETGIVIGYAAFYRMADMPAPVEIGLWLDPAEWGKGLATEAAHALIDMAFADGRVGVLWGGVRVSDARARRVLEKCGFQFRGAGLGANGMAIERYVLDRGNWASLKAWGAASARRHDAA